MKKIETFTLPETRFLSNFYPYKDKEGNKYPEKFWIRFDGIDFDCTENAYQAAKSLDREVRKLISEMNPFESKKYWRGKEDQIRPDWDDVKYELMKNFNQQKFYGYPDMYKMLLATGDAILEEGNTWGDVYWGISDGIGENNLGKLLMEIRDTLPLPVLYKTKEKKLVKSNVIMPDCTFVGVFILPDENLVISVADNQMLFEDAILYFQKRELENLQQGYVWRFLEWNDTHKFCEKISNMHYNTLFKLGIDINHDLYPSGSDDFAMNFASARTWYTLSQGQRENYLLTVALVIKFKE